MSGQRHPASGDQDEAIGEALRMVAQARRALDEAAVACGLDPDDWSAVVDPSRCTPENCRRLAEVADQVCRPAVLKALEVAR